MLQFFLTDFTSIHALQTDCKIKHGDTYRSTKHIVTGKVTIESFQKNIKVERKI